jgi:hypothetical protein
VIGTGKRTGKTAVAGHWARLLRERDPVIVCMGRGGPREPTLAEPTTSLDDLLELAEHDAIGGRIAGVPPEMTFHDGIARSGESFWDELHLHAGLIPPVLRAEHTDPALPDELRPCPPYFNLGVLAAGADTMARLGATIFRELDAVNSFGDSWYRCQLAVTLAIARTGCNWADLPLRWNFPNDDAFWHAYAEDRADVRILHYLRQGELDREGDMGSVAGVERLLERPALSPVHELLRGRVAAVRDELVAPARA